MKAARPYGLAVLPGMELQTVEEVHLLCLFDSLAQLDNWQAQVSQALPPLENNIEYFGEQFVVDESGDFIRREQQLLLTSTTFSLESAIQKVTNLGGLAIPAHVDRRAYGLIANLGFVPADIRIEALEISRHLKPENARQVFPQLEGYPLIQSGDVHRLEEFLGVNEFIITCPTVAELRMALANESGRRFSIREAHV
jgi:hypothetical protein